MTNATTALTSTGLELKQQALDKTTPTSGSPGRYHPDDVLLAFLKSL
jgi:hypothetical protein